MNNANPVHFDESLGAFVSLLDQHLGASALERGLVLRDIEGRLAFVAPEGVDEPCRAALEAALQQRLGAYARGAGRDVLDPDSPAAELFRKDSRISTERVAIDDERTVAVRLLDRRAAGSDWLIAPDPGWITPPARMVFASLKGGVGRSTALAVLAVDLARTGASVLAVDLDLEAPGLGEMLVSLSDRPRFGALDWYVESGLGVVDDEFLDDLVAPSRLGAGSGLINVVPAVGAVAEKYPANVLAKLSRAYLGGSSEQGAMSFLDQTRSLIDRLVARRRYDAVLVDARAGLSETTAAAILGLGADVLLFGIDTPQTFAAHRYLLAHLSRFPRNTEDDTDWLSRLKVVHAKAAADPELQKRFRDKAFEAFDDLAYRDVPLGEEPSELEITRREFGLDDPDAPHHAWVVLSDANYFQFDPLSDPGSVAESSYQRSFSNLLASARERLALEEHP